MELSEEVKKKVEHHAQWCRVMDMDSEEFENCKKDYMAGYLQALKDKADKEAKHRKNVMEIGMKTMAGEI